MASEEVKKKWGTIFMGNREASVEQLKAMQEPLQREQRKKEQAEDYMERVRARAADRAREILGAAYAERQKVLEEARAEANAQKKNILGDCDRIRMEAESIRKQARDELARAEQERREAEILRNNAHNEGYRAGIEQSTSELHEFRLELGQALGRLLGALEWQQNEILKNWRDDLVTLVQCASQAGAGYVLGKEHEAIIRGLVFQALDLLESRRSISIKVNPEDEAQVTDLFRAARERYPELSQWIVTGDENIEKGGLVAESGSGSVDLKRENFREMVNGVLAHLSLPKGNNEARYEEMIREIVEREATRITSLTPELPLPEMDFAENETPMVEDLKAEPSAVLVEDESSEPLSDSPEERQPVADLPEEREDGLYTMNLEQDEILPDSLLPEEEDLSFRSPEEEPVAAQDVSSSDPTLAALEEELFPLDDEAASGGKAEEQSMAGKEKAASPPKKEELKLEPETLAEGGFL